MLLLFFCSLMETLNASLGAARSKNVQSRACVKRFIGLLSPDLKGEK